MNRQTGLSIAMLLLCATCGNTWADEPQQQEAKKELYGKLKRADIDQDGKLNYDEFKAFNEIILKRKFDAMDANHDGSIDAEEQHADHDSALQEKPSSLFPGNGKNDASAAKDRTTRRERK